MSDEMQHRVRVQMTGEPNTLGEFEILAITAGVGNGWTFTEEALRASLPLWEGAHSFVDHEGWLSTGRSVRDLAGMCHSPQWDETRRGVKMQLRPTGPSGPLLAALAQEMCSDREHKPAVGFSADILFTSKGNKVVDTILRVLSLDLVFNPARGGSFLRALNAVGRMVAPQEVPMPESTSTTGPAAPAREPAALRTPCARRCVPTCSTAAWRRRGCPPRRPRSSAGSSRGACSSRPSSARPSRRSAAWSPT
jgi:hypothetical protein